jgi:uncharacterized protein YoxC
MPLTPEQFEKLVTKEDLKDLEEKIDKKFDKRIDEVLTAIDGLAKSVKDMKDESAMNISTHDRFEKRITKLEKSKVMINS